MELAERFGTVGETDSWGFVHAPADMGIERMWLALHAGEPDQAVSVAQDVRPESHPFVFGQAQYWVHYGTALAQLRGHHDDAVLALRTAEDIFPTNVRRDPIVREVIATLLPGAGRNAVGAELRGMAYRVGLPTR